jgi:ABC-type transport system involved in cytochrome c biogenesis ATPase subunit
LDKDGQELLNTILARHCGNGGAVLAATHMPLSVGTKRELILAPTEVLA